MKIRLPGEQWSKLLEFLRTRPNVYVGKEDECRRFVEGVLWILRLEQRIQAICSLV
jgi:hypothetical protein